MDISVVIPTYNRARFLRRALDSVYNQSLLPQEVIVVDDGSDDDTADFIRHRYPEVRYQYQPKRGVSSARNRGIEMSCGEWVALLDSDDAWQPNKLHRQCTALQANSDYLVCHTDEIWVRHGRRVNPMKKHAKKGGRVFRDNLPLCAISPSSAMIHRKIFEKVGGFDESLPVCEDYDLWLRICSRYPILFVEECLLTKYGGHSDQLSRHHWGMDRFRIQALENIIESGTLRDKDRSAAVGMLLRKCTILLQGAKKRRNHSLIKQCERILLLHPQPFEQDAVAAR